jgi:hypothetical protein
MKFLAGTVILMVAEIVVVFLIYSYKREVRSYFYKLNSTFQFIYHIVCKKILKQAGSLFQKFISEYFDDSDLRYLVDKIQSDVIEIIFFFNSKLNKKIENKTFK